MTVLGEIKEAESVISCLCYASVMSEWPVSLGNLLIKKINFKLEVKQDILVSIFEI